MFVVIRTLPLFMTYHWVCNKSNTTGARCGSGTGILPEYQSSLPIFSGVPVARSLVFCVVFCRSLFVSCSFSFGHGIVCPSFGHGIVCPSFGHGIVCPSLSVLHLAMVLSVLHLAMVLSVLRFTASDNLVSSSFFSKRIMFSILHNVGSAVSCAQQLVLPFNTMLGRKC